MFRILEVLFKCFKIINKNIKKTLLGLYLGYLKDSLNF